MEEMLSLTATELSLSAQQGTEEIEGTIAALEGFCEVLRRLAKLKKSHYLHATKLQVS